MGGDGCNEGLLVLMAFNFGGVAACSRGAITWDCCKSLPLKVGIALEVGAWCTCLCHAAAHHVQPCALESGLLWLPVRMWQPFSKVVFLLQAAK